MNDATTLFSYASFRVPIITYVTRPGLLSERKHWGPKFRLPWHVHLCATDVFSAYSSNLDSFFGISEAKISGIATSQHSVTNNRRFAAIERRTWVSLMLPSPVVRLLLLELLFSERFFFEIDLKAASIVSKPNSCGQMSLAEAFKLLAELVLYFAGKGLRVSDTIVPQTSFLYSAILEGQTVQRNVTLQFEPTVRLIIESSAANSK